MLLIKPNIIFLQYILFVKYNYNDQVKEHEMGRTCSKHGGSLNIHKFLVGKFEGKISVAIYNRRLEDNIKMDFRDVS
jgi:hypothetical protein